MTVKLTKELGRCLNAAGKVKHEDVNPDTRRTSFVVDSDTHRRAMDALRSQEDRHAIAQGIAEMEAGEGIPVEEARRLTRQRLLARG